MVRSTAWDPSDPEDLPKNALFPDIPDIYAHKASKPLHETELNYLEKQLRAHEEIPADLCEDPKSIVYRYLLLSTRLNMGVNRSHGGIDGTETFERLSPHILTAYLGIDATESLVFGTAQRGTFGDKVNDLCRCIGEGGGYVDRNGRGASTNDGGLDTAAWKPFADRQPGKLILFAQCKTGTSWRTDATRLRPETFVDRWFIDPPLLRPIRAYCVAEAVPQNEWNLRVQDAGLLFDRCRIVSLSSSVPESLLEEIHLWTEAARKFVFSEAEKKDWL
jgi:hypothetical protein